MFPMCAVACPRGYPVAARLSQALPGRLSPCPRETRSPTPPSGSGRSWRARCPTRSAPRSVATRWINWPQRLAGRAIPEIRTHGKHLFLRFEGDLTLHSHLRMTGSWGVYPPGRRWRRAPRRAWLVLRRGDTEVVEFDGPVLELMTESRTRFDRRLAALGPDILAPEFDYGRFLARLRGDDPTRGIGDALLDQRNLAGIGNLWKAESCWDAAIDPWRPVGQISDEEVAGDRRRGPAADAGLGRHRRSGLGAPRVPAQRRGLPPLSAPRSGPGARVTTIAPPSGARAASAEADASGPAERASGARRGPGRRRRPSGGPAEP